MQKSWDQIHCFSYADMSNKWLNQAMEGTENIMQLAINYMLSEAERLTSEICIQKHFTEHSTICISRIYLNCSLAHAALHSLSANEVLMYEFLSQER